MPTEGYSGTVHRKGQPLMWPSASKVICKASPGPDD
jgi:hypothetical protein